MKYYANVRWCSDDILALRPEWTEEQAEVWLVLNERYIQDAIVQAGWEVLDSLIGFTEVKDE